jgi:hypothetical protein
MADASELGNAPADCASFAPISDLESIGRGMSFADPWYTSGTFWTAAGVGPGLIRRRQPLKLTLLAVGLEPTLTSSATALRNVDVEVLSSESQRRHAILMGLAFLIICLAIQFRTRRYVPWIYWLAVTAVSIFGTMSADFLNKDLGMPLYASTLMPLGFQAAVFIAW